MHAQPHFLPPSSYKKKGIRIGNKSAIIKIKSASSNIKEN